MSRGKRGRVGDGQGVGGEKGGGVEGEGYGKGEEGEMVSEQLAADCPSFRGLTDFF